MQVTLTTDDRGFRNPSTYESSDIVVLGDSFAEGSRVDDTECWARQLEHSLGRPVYNLAISGGSPRNYQNHFLAFGTELSPRVVLCMVYEGNDLKVHSADRREEASTLRKLYEDVTNGVKGAPTIKAMRDWVDGTFSKWNRDGSVPDAPALSWMPIVLDAGGARNAYAFEPKRLERLYYSPAEFADYKGWKRARGVFTELKAACDEYGAALIFVYAPSAAHVSLPLIEDRVPAEGLHQFFAYEEDDIPPPAEFKTELYARLDTCEESFAAFCDSIGVDVIRTTEALRDAMAAGTQVYYTYDQHWTHHGHDVVTDVVADYLQGSSGAARLVVGGPGLAERNRRGDDEIEAARGQDPTGSFGRAAPLSGSARCWRGARLDFVSSSCFATRFAHPR